MQIQLSDLWNVGNRLRAINEEIKTALAELGQAPIGSVPESVATSLHNLQKAFEQARGYYAEVYRTVHGSMPSGLGAAVALLGVSLTMWAWLVGSLAVGGLIWRYERDLNSALTGWRERMRIEAIEGLPPEDRADILRRMPVPGVTDWGAWIQSNLLLVAAGVLVTVLVLKRS